MQLPYYILQTHLGKEITCEKMGAESTNYKTGTSSRSKTTTTISVVLLTNKVKYMFNRTTEVATYDLRILTSEVLAIYDRLIINSVTYEVKGTTYYDQYEAYVVYLEIVQ